LAALFPFISEGGLAGFRRVSGRAELRPADALPDPPGEPLAAPSRRALGYQGSQAVELATMAVCRKRSSNLAAAERLAVASARESAQRTVTMLAADDTASYAYNPMSMHSNGERQLFQAARRSCETHR
jgi:hypothetical protein